MYSKLAKQAAEYFIKNKELLPPPSILPEELKQQRACFITIIENPGHHIKGMHGTLLPQQKSLAEEVIVNTAQAAFRLRRVDLPYLSYQVAIAGPPQRITAVDHFDPTRFGVYARSDSGKTAVILPSHPGIETAQDQVATAMRQLGVDTKIDTVTLYRFEVKTHAD